MSASPHDDIRALIRFLVSNVGHPVVLDREDCALLTEWVERSETLEEVMHGREVRACRFNPAALAS
jgi:hypothetical protein